MCIDIKFLVGWKDQRCYVLGCRCVFSLELRDTRVLNSSLFEIAMAIMIYALYTYHWRAASIRRGGRGPYDDRLGPVSSVNALP